MSNNDDVCTTGATRELCESCDSGLPQFVNTAMRFGLMHLLSILNPLSKFRSEPSEQLHSLAIYHLLNPFFNL